MPVADRLQMLWCMVFGFDPDDSGMLRYMRNLARRTTLLDDYYVRVDTDKLDENDVGEAVAKAIDTV